MHRDVNSRRWHWAVNVVAASPAVGRPLRGRLLRRAGIDAGTAIVEPGCFFFGARVHLGDWTYVNHGCYFDARDEIVLGDRCALGMQVLLCTSSHAPGDASRRAGEYESSPIVVGDGTWIGARAVVLPGVSIGPGCVVGAGAVVTGDLDAHGLYAGVPARRVRDLDGP